MTLLENPTRVTRTVRFNNEGIVEDQLRRQEEEKQRQEKSKASAGQRSWSILHRYRGCDPVFFEAWQHSIPAMCDCRNEFKKIVEKHPPEFSSPEAFFRWGWFVHNAVNEKLGKPLVDLDDALKQWRNDASEIKDSGSSS